MKSPCDEATAYHEAGHAVVALILRRPVDEVSVLANRHFLGVGKFGKAGVRPSEDWLEREMLIALGGIAAEARHTGNYAWGDHRGKRPGLTTSGPLVIPHLPRCRPVAHRS
jgi:ATP-dependent Zn protease